MKKLFNFPHGVYLWSIGLIFIACFFFFNWDYRYVDDYKMFLHNDSLAGFLNSHKWGFSRILGNYFFGILYFPQSNVILNLGVLLCHLLNGWLIFKILSQKSQRTIAFFSALLFISIPITSEAFFWALAGQVVYAVFFFLLGVNYYLKHQDKMSFKRILLLVVLMMLSISFYEVFILFPFLFFLFCLFAKKNRLVGLALSLTSAGYLGTLKLVLFLTGASLNAQLKTTPIPLSEAPHRLFQIAKDVTNVFIGKVAFRMYSTSFSDAFNGAVSWELWSVVGILVLITLVDIWWIYKYKKEKIVLNLDVIFASLLIGLSLTALLTVPVNYFHDLRTFYPFTICVALFIGEALHLFSGKTVYLKLGLTALILVIAANILTLKVENYHYANLYQIDMPLARSVEEFYDQGKNTIIYLPGYNASRPLETQMNLAYYPEANFIYGTHMLSVASIRFTRTPYTILGSHQEIKTAAAADPASFMVYDFVQRKMLSASEFLTPTNSTQLDLTALPVENYTFTDMSHDIKKTDASVIFNRKLYKTIITHPNCAEQPATVEITTPPLQATCTLSFRLFNVKDTEKRTISDGTKVEVFVNGKEEATLPLKPIDPEQPKILYEYPVSPQSASSAAKIRFAVTDGGNKNCNDDKIFIAEPILRCQK